MKIREWGGHLGVDNNVLINRQKIVYFSYFPSQTGHRSRGERERVLKIVVPHNFKIVTQRNSCDILGDIVQLWNNCRSYCVLCTCLYGHYQMNQFYLVQQSG